MVRFLDTGVCKITHLRYLVEIFPNFVTNVYRKQDIGKPFLLIDSFDNVNNKIDCLFKAFEIINEHNKRSNHLM